MSVLYKKLFLISKNLSNLSDLLNRSNLQSIESNSTDGQSTRQTTGMIRKIITVSKPFNSICRYIILYPNHKLSRWNSKKYSGRSWVLFFAYDFNCIRQQAPTDSVKQNIRGLFHPNQNTSKQNPLKMVYCGAMPLSIVYTSNCTIFFRILCPKSWF